MKRDRVALGWSLVLAVSAAVGCDSRSEAMQRQIKDSTTQRNRVEIAEAGPSHPIREQLEPVLSKIYPLNQVPRIVEEPVPVGDDYRYQLEPGVAAVIRFPPGLSTEQQVQAVVTGVAEADSWAFRENARHPYASLVQRVFRGHGEAQKEQILKAYAHLRLLQFFNSEEAGPAIAALPADLQGPVKQMQAHYTQEKEQIWADWMGVKMYARRVVAGEEPFRSVLRQIKKELGQEEPPPRTWEESMDGPFLAWAKELRNEEELMIRLTNLKELREREEYYGDTHTLFVMQGSDRVPAKAADIPIDKQLGFGVLREDLGGGHNELTFVFSRRLKGPKLKKAFLEAIVYGHLLHDFQMLATAGSDFAERSDDNVIDATTSIVPDEYDPVYAKCGSRAAIDTLVANYREDYAILSNLRPDKPKKALDIAHKCVIKGAEGKIYVPPKDSEMDVEGPAPGSLVALEQMLTRYEKLDINLAAMAAVARTEEDDEIDDLEAKLKALQAQQ